MIRKVSFALLALCTLISCDKQRIFDEYQAVGPAWHKDSVVRFKFTQPDTVQSYNLFVNVRDNNDYPYSNLFLIVSMLHPGGLTTVDTLEYQMANPDGTLLGDGFSSIKENKLFYREKQRFPQAGEYEINIRQAVRPTGKVEGANQLEGISEVGFRVESMQ